MTDFTCPECNGTGVYQGLNTVEPCRACGGKKRIGALVDGLTASTEGFSTALQNATEACRRFAGQSLLHEIEELATEELPTIHLSLDDRSKSECHRDYYEIDRGHWVERHPYSTIYVTLTDAIFNPEEYELVWAAATSGDLVTLKVSDQCGAVNALDKSVQIVDFELNVETDRANLTFEIDA